jgi:GNAT superfamily N-acetyltransferase
MSLPWAVGGSKLPGEAPRLKIAGNTCERDMIEIRLAELPRELAQVRGLFREYADGLGIDLGFQDFETELATLPGKYAAPAGRLLLAWSGTEAVGCAALRALENRACEMKRLYVRPVLRRRQIGRQLAERICQEAREAGYSRICLDTVPTQVAATRLYMTLRFKPIEPYVFNLISGAMFLALEL